MRMSVRTSDADIYGNLMRRTCEILVRMKKDDAIAHLTALVDRVSELEQMQSDNEPFKQWQQESQAALKRLFTSSPEYARDFASISYGLSFITTDTPASAWEEAYQEGLQTARAYLRARIEEIKSFGLGIDIPAAAATKKGDPSIVFTIHGRQLIGEFHDFLRAIGLKPLEWGQARAKLGKPNPYTWEVVDWALQNAGAIVAFMTPDDEARLKEALWSPTENALEKELMGQPRQNVLFEAGVAYGRNPERTVLLRVGSHRPMSDLAGHHILQLSNAPESRQAVADALKAAGCPVDLTGADWYKAGDFSNCR